MRVGEARKSECRSVMERIPIATSSDAKAGRLLAGVSTRESRPNRLREQANDGGLEVPLMRLSRKEIGSLCLSRSRQVRLSAGSFTMAFEMLEPCDTKVSSTVLRGRKVSNHLPLPGEGSSVPFTQNPTTLGALSKSDAIALVIKTLGENQWLPEAGNQDENDLAIERLVETAGCHARALVLLTSEIRRTGIRNATENFAKIMHDMERSHPDDRERSLIASVKLSLDRLPPETRQLIRPLCVFKDGGSLMAIQSVLQIEDALSTQHLIRQIQNVGLADLESLFSQLAYKRALFKVAQIREAAAQKLTHWSNAVFEAERAKIDRLLDKGEADLISVGMAAWGKASVREQDSVQEELAVLDGVLSAALMAMVILLE